MKKILFILILLVFVVGCTEKPVACTEEAKICSDGSSVGRIPPDCEFAECPEFVDESLVNTNIAEEELVIEETDEVVEENDIEKDPNLIAHWKFDSDVKDSANNYHGTIMGNAAFREGKFGKALYFDGVDDYVDFSKEVSDKLGSFNQGTIAFWFNYQSLLDKQTIMPIFYLGMDDEKDEDNVFIIEIGHFDEKTSGALAPNNKKLYSTWTKDNKEPFLCYDSNVNVAENQWHHYALVVSSEGNTGYLNGVEMTDRYYNFGSSKDTAFLNDISVEKFMLGYGRSSWMVGANFVYYKGLLDDFRVYDKALSGEEIKSLI